MNTIKVCTYNIRYDTDGDGINSFAGRSAWIRECLPKIGADLIGFQEAQPHVRCWLENNLEGYCIIGSGREKDYGGEHTCIAYKKDALTLVTLDTFWLSDTPRIPGTRFHSDQSGCPRICTAALFRERKTGTMVYMYNTHLDHVGKMSRMQAITLILSRIAEDTARIPAKVILTGDMNVLPDSPVVASVTQFATPTGLLRDVTADVGGTFHGYRPTELRMKIDYIFTDMDCDTARSRAITDCTEDGVYLSDHYPVLAELAL